MVESVRMKTELDPNQNRETEPNTVPMLIIIRGIPGSGKSAISKELVRQLNSSSTRDVTLIDPDENVYKNSDANTQTSTSREDLQIKAMVALQKGGVVIWDQLLTSIDSLEKINLIKKLIQPAVLTLIEISLETEVAWDRVLKRQELGEQFGPDRDQFDDYLSKWSSLHEAGLDGLILVDGNQSVEESTRVILNGLNL